MCEIGNIGLLAETTALRQEKRTLNSVELGAIVRRWKSEEVLNLPQ